MFKLGEALKTGGAEKDCEVFKAEIDKIELEQRAISIEKQMLLEFSIENQVVIHIYAFMTWVTTEKKKEDGTWVRAFATYNDFNKANDEELINKLALIATIVNKDDFSKL
jgi:hypothetical protein